MGISSYSYSFFLFSFVVIIPTLEAHIAEYDEYWKARELEAIENLDKAYHSNPEEVVRHYNDHFSRTMLEFYITKRVLAESKKDPFEVTNHVDSCWRYDPDSEKNRKKLVDCAPGFARGTTGGKDGEFYVVPNPIDNAADPKPGTLRHAVTQTEPLWITFKGSMTIKLQQELIVTSDKTIDAREANVEIFNGAGITIQYAKNVTNHGLQIHHIIPANGGKIKDGENHHGLRGDSDEDGVSLFGATNVWLNHLSLHHYTDGLIDVMLFGASDSYKADKKMQVTVALNHFGKGLVERMPRCRFGFIHVVNNDYNHWFLYAIGGTSNPTIISQGNRYSAPGTFGAKKNWNWVSQGDHFEKGAFFTPSGNPSASKQIGADKMMPFKPGQMVPEFTKYAEPLSCTIGRPC
ncbi:hypothetical protein ES332_D05G353700v1 [Gossypium tomentosum]|uniref:Pectate lyase n=1 Tax=Gossypium tomentosum TaxID=34277 RepID=A0A5D2L3Y6_GOSTO|nr:hypothetical protein ES332_D05G353700v1 [Gossypium tomentosum]